MQMAWIEILKQDIAWAYEFAGISQVSAASKIPSNVESGKMLDLIENSIEDYYQQVSFLLG